MLRQLVRAARRRWAGRPLDDDITLYPWLNVTHTALLKTPGGAYKPEHAYGVLQATSLAQHLHIPQIAALEFGVAGGNGLVALEQIAQAVERVVPGVVIEVYGFDAGTGLPPPLDYRDTPNLFCAQAFPMDVPRLQARLQRAQLILGPIGETVPRFAASTHAPIGFIAFDVDLYSSTVHALQILTAPSATLLPRIACYFDDNLGCTYSDFTGERLALQEFNAADAPRKVSLIYGLRHFVSRTQADKQWVDKMYLAHIFDHARYCEPDGLVRTTRMDLR